LAYCKANNCGLAVAKIDRLSRNTEQALQVYNDLSGFLFSADIPMQKFTTMEKFQLTLLLAFAERERFLISQRTKQALAKSTKDKGFNNPIIKQAVLNSAILAEGAIGKHQIYEAANNLNSGRAKDKICELQKIGLNFLQIAKKLNSDKNGKNELKYPAPKGGTWQAVQVQRIFTKYASA